MTLFDKENYRVRGAKNDNREPLELYYEVFTGHGYDGGDGLALCYPHVADFGIRIGFNEDGEPLKPVILKPNGEIWP